MACESMIKPGQTLAQRSEEVRVATKRLETALTQGRVQVVIGTNGGIAFRGWNVTERDGVSDACGYRVLTADGSSALRMAIARAEAVSGRKVNPRAVAMGVHSHDGGKTWDRH